MEQRYDRIGLGYSDRRRSDPRLAAAIWRALGDAESIVNVGAGAGSYEPQKRAVVAVEPAWTMIRQRPAGSAPVVRACAEALPFPDDSFEAALAVLSIHHWSDWRGGLREMIRVASRRVVLLTWDPQSGNSWLGDYFPQVVVADRARFPGLGAMRDILGDIEIAPVRIPHDCTDGFLGAYWRRPSAYLESGVRDAISALATGASSASLARLADDLDSGAWLRKHGKVLEQEELDLGYRLLVADVAFRARR